MKDYEQMRKVLKDHCDNYIVDDPFESVSCCHGCVLEDFKPCLCTAPDILNGDEVELRYNKLMESKGEDLTPSADIDVKAIMEEKVIEHDGCFNCVYENRSEFDTPCNKCKGTAIHGTDDYEKRPDLFKPIEIIDGVEDIINHPNHYTNGGMECIDEMLLIFGKRVVADFCLCNAWKYRYRALSKNGQEDIDKSHWYMAKYKELVEDMEDCNDEFYNQLP